MWSVDNTWLAHDVTRCAAAGRGVFDGNVKVQRAAQRTDANQLSRNLLLVPKATVNVKPNLQIVADDVKCTHGCTVSDLEERQLFYFKSAPHSPPFFDILYTNVLASQSGQPIRLTVNGG